ncbi:MAG: DUF917 family protein [Emergencia sp.]|nr:DUF917 family protein [Emergencia sp.]
MVINSNDIQKIALGSLILGGGGGGNIQEGLDTAAKALKLGKVEVLPLSEVADRDGVVITISGVGSPASDTAFYSDDVYEKILHLIQTQLDKKIIGFIPCEMGGSSSFEPFIPAALLQLPIINSACDGRAHPFGIMGSLGLEKGENYTIQAGAGGRKETDTYVEILASGSIESTSDLIRNAAAKAGGAVAVARNPVSLSWLEDSGADGAYDLAEQLGEAYLSGSTPLESLQNICPIIDGKIICCGIIDGYTLHTENALDNGHFIINDGSSAYKMYFFNEYMALEKDGERLNTFPDLMVTVDAEDGRILPTSDIRDGQKVILFSAPKEKMILGKGLRYRSTYKRIEDLLRIPMQEYIDDIFLD